MNTNRAKWVQGGNDGVESARMTEWGVYCPLQQSPLSKNKYAFYKKNLERVLTFCHKIDTDFLSNFYATLH